MKKMYKLIGHEVELVTDPWLEEFNDTFWNPENRRVAQTTVASRYTISTVFLVFDHNFNNLTECVEPPLLFETMVFGPESEDEICLRCSTWEQAIEQHENAIIELCDKLKSMQEFDVFVNRGQEENALRNRDTTIERDSLQTDFRFGIPPTDDSRGRDLVVIPSSSREKIDEDGSKK